MIKHSEEFNEEAMRLALTSGLPRARLAADSGVGKSALERWLADYRPDDVVSLPQADLALENEPMRLASRIFEEERDILKKTTQFFPKERP